MERPIPSPTVTLRRPPHHIFLVGMEELICNHIGNSAGGFVASAPWSDSITPLPTAGETAAPETFKDELCNERGHGDETSGSEVAGDVDAVAIDFTLVPGQPLGFIWRRALGAMRYADFCTGKGHQPFGSSLDTFRTVGLSIWGWHALDATGVGFSMPGLRPDPRSANSTPWVILFGKDVFKSSIFEPMLVRTSWMSSKINSIARRVLASGMSRQTAKICSMNSLQPSEHILGRLSSVDVVK